MSIEPEENLALDVIPYQPVAKLAVVRASPSGKDSLRGRGKNNVLWMHLECNERCIEYLNGTNCYTRPTTVVNYTLASFAHRVQPEQRGFLSAAENLKLDLQSISILRQWQTGKEKGSLNGQFEAFRSLEAAKAEEEVNLTPSYTAFAYMISPGRDRLVSRKVWMPGVISWISMSCSMYWRNT